MAKSYLTGRRRKRFPNPKQGSSEGHFPTNALENHSRAFCWLQRQIGKFKKRVLLFPCCLALSTLSGRLSKKSHPVDPLDITAMVARRDVSTPQDLTRVISRLHADNPFTLGRHDLLIRVTSKHLPTAARTPLVTEPDAGFVYLETRRTTKVLKVLPTGTDTSINPTRRGQNRYTASVVTKNRQVTNS